MKRFNWSLLFFMSALIILGIFFVYSANAARSIASVRLLYRQQAELALVGIAISFLATFVDYKKVLKFSVIFYLFSLLLLILVITIGTSRMGARRWVFGIQPSEIAKLSTIMLLSTYLGRPDNEHGVREFLIALGITLIPVGLIIVQPDLGTAVIFFPILAVLLFASQTAPKLLFSTVSAGILSVVIILGSVYLGSREDLSPSVRKCANSCTFFLGDYQRGRLLDFIFPDRDPINKGWNRRQSQIAVGSGGMWGKGFRKGDQNILGYIPQQVSANDFIFSVIAEEAGFAGSLFVLCCFGGLIVSVLTTGALSQDDPGRLLCHGIATLVFCHVFINIAMTIGLVPVTGLPLPFVSYGRTFMLTMTMAMGIVQSVSVHSRAIKSTDELS